MQVYVPRGRRHQPQVSEVTSHHITPRHDAETAYRIPNISSPEKRSQQNKDKSALKSSSEKCALERTSEVEKTEGLPVNVEIDIDKTGFNRHNSNALQEVSKEASVSIIQSAEEEMDDCLGVNQTDNVDSSRSGVEFNENQDCGALDHKDLEKTCDITNACAGVVTDESARSHAEENLSEKHSEITGDTRTKSNGSIEKEDTNCGGNTYDIMCELERKRSERIASKEDDVGLMDCQMCNNVKTSEQADHNLLQENKQTEQAEDTKHSNNILHENNYQGLLKKSDPDIMSNSHRQDENPSAINEEPDDIKQPTEVMVSGDTHTTSSSSHVVLTHKTDLVHLESDFRNEPVTELETLNAGNSLENIESSDDSNHGQPENEKCDEEFAHVTDKGVVSAGVDACSGNQEQVKTVERLAAEVPPEEADEDSWDAMFNDDGECLDPDAMREARLLSCNILVG